MGVHHSTLGMDTPHQKQHSTGKLVIVFGALLSGTGAMALLMELILNASQPQLPSIDTPALYFCMDVMFVLSGLLAMFSKRKQFVTLSLIFCIVSVTIAALLCTYFQTQFNEGLLQSLFNRRSHVTVLRSHVFTLHDLSSSHRPETIVLASLDLTGVLLSLAVAALTGRALCLSYRETDWSNPPNLCHPHYHLSGDYRIPTLRTVRPPRTPEHCVAWLSIS